MRCWAVQVDGRLFRLDDLPVGLLADVEEQAGVAWWQLEPHTHASHLRAIARVLGGRFGFDPDRVRLRDLQVAEDDVPFTFVDGAPEGGRSIDRWVCDLFKAGVTPRQVREDFTMRDLHLLREAGR